MLGCLSRVGTRYLLSDLFFAEVLYSMKCEETNRVTALATDGITLYVNPKYIAGLKLDTQRTAVAHVLLHKTLYHVADRNKRDKKKWNAACNIQSAMILREEGWDDPWIERPEFFNMTVSQIYDRMPDGPSQWDKLDETVLDFPRIYFEFRRSMRKIQSRFRAKETVRKGGRAEHLHLYYQYPAIEEIQENPTTVPLPEDAPTLFAMIMEFAQGLGIQTMNQYEDFVNRLPGEAKVVLLHSIDPHLWLMHKKFRDLAMSKEVKSLIR